MILLWRAQEGKTPYLPVFRSTRVRSLAFFIGICTQPEAEHKLCFPKYHGVTHRHQLWHWKNHIWPMFAYQEVVGAGRPWSLAPYVGATQPLSRFLQCTGRSDCGTVANSQHLKSAIKIRISSAMGPEVCAAASIVMSYEIGLLNVTPEFTYETIGLVTMFSYVIIIGNSIVVILRLLACMAQRPSTQHPRGSFVKILPEQYTNQ